MATLDDILAKLNEHSDLLEQFRAHLDSIDSSLAVICSQMHEHGGRIEHHERLLRATPIPVGE